MIIKRLKMFSNAAARKAMRAAKEAFTAKMAPKLPGYPVPKKFLSEGFKTVENPRYNSQVKNFIKYDLPSFRQGQLGEKALKNMELNNKINVNSYVKHGRYSGNKNVLNYGNKKAAGVAYDHGELNLEPSKIRL